MWGAHLSPDGTRFSFLHMHEASIPVALILAEDGSLSVIAASRAGKFDIRWCRWANNDRLLCGYYGIDNDRGILFPVTRMIAVNADASDQIVLLQKQLEKKSTQFQDDIVDWLPDDPEHVLVEIPDRDGTGVARLNIYTGKTRTVARVREGTREWRADGHGQLRLRQHVSRTNRKWYYRLADEKDWRVLREWAIDDIGVDYYPIGFGAERNTLMVYKPYAGRLALWAEDLEGKRDDELVFAHDEADVGHMLTLGKHQRHVAVGYSTDKSRLFFFDAEVRTIVEKISNDHPGENVSVIDESWDKRYYLIHISSDRNPGQYFRFDAETNTLRSTYAARPELNGRTLATMSPVQYAASDGVDIPAYLTLPPGEVRQGLPAVILPHGGPESRDNWDFDWLAQFMAARGYAVLQMNFRGSGGFGDEWAGAGGFRAWERTVEDINDGSRWLIEQGIADPARLCIVGWSYGGYAALMSSIVAPHMYQCTVSIAGVTDPRTLINDSRHFLNSRAVREFVGTKTATLDQGSPLQRAGEIESPVLLFHGDRDLNVNVKHSKKMHKALKKERKSTELIIYDDIGHSIWRDNYRIDMLTKIGAFLDQSLESS